MSGTNKQPLLSICIPTWNRAKFLRESLVRLYSEYKELNKIDVEFIVSDNFSEDETAQVVIDFQQKGFPIMYNRNNENIGAARNFLKCMEMSKGKYILLLGDDDFFCEHGLKRVIELIRGGDFGLIHICKYPNEHQNYWVYSDPEKFLKKVSFWITFMSGNIFRKDIIDEIVDPMRFVPTHLLQVPYFIVSALSKPHNIVINNKGIMTIGVDYKSNGGYNVYEVFVQSYLNIWKEFVEKQKISIRLYNFLMKDLYLRHLLPFNIDLLILKKDIAEESIEYLKSRKGYKIKGAKHILYDYYKWKPYYYYSGIIVMWRGFMMFFKGLLKIYIRKE